MVALILLAGIGIAFGLVELATPLLAPILNMAAWVVWCVLYVIYAGIVCLVGAVDDALYNRKVAAGKKAYRLPFYYRWKGWRLGGPNYDDHHRWQQGQLYDQKNKRIVLMYRPL